MLTSLLVAAVTAQPTLQPVGPWNVRFEDSLCLLERRYQADGQPISLIFQPLLDLQDMELFVVTADKSDKQVVGEYTARLGSGEPQKGSYFSVLSKQLKLRVTRLSMDRGVLDGMKHGDVLSIEAQPISRAFLIVQPDKAKAALTGCIDDLKKAWGIDPAGKERMAFPLEGNPAKYFGTKDYPSEAWNNGIYGRVIALLNIDNAGAVSACRILSSAGTALNAGTCKAAMKIRFKPARDVTGKPMSSTYVLPVRWVLPGTDGGPNLKTGSRIPR